MSHRFKHHNLFKHFFLATLLLAVTACDNTGVNEQQILHNAKTYLDKDELMAASIELRNILQKNNNNAEARYLLANIHLKIGDLTSAEKEFRRAADAGWSQEEVQLQLARIFISKKEFKEFLDQIETVDTWSVDTRANIAGLRALAEAGQNDITAAKSALKKGRSLNENAAQVLRATAILQLSGMLEGDASSTLKTAKSLYPDNPEILLIDASNYIKNKKLTLAADTYNTVIALDPAKLLTANGRRARIGLARLQIIDKNFKAASTTLEPLLKRNDKDPEVNFLSGLLALNQGNYKLAEDHVRKLLAVVPDNSQAQQLMGKIKYALNDFVQAAHHLSIYLSTTPDDIAIRKQLTNTFIILNQLDQARSTLQPALSLNPEDAGTQVLLSQIEFNSGDFNASVQALNKAIKSSPDNVELHKQLAKAYIANGKTKQALNELKTFQKLSKDKDTEEIQKLTITAYLNAGEINSAMNVASELLEKEPQNPNLVALKGSLYAADGNMQQAREYLNIALKLEANLPSAVIGLARLETIEGHPDKAIALYKSLVKSGKGGAAPMLALASLAATQERTNDMLSWLEKARNVSPAEIRARMILAKYYLQNTQPQKAEIYTKEAIKQSPENIDLIMLHGKVMIAQQRYSEALPSLKQLVTKLSESTTAHSLLGETFLRQQMLDNAREHLEKALSIQQDNIIAISLLAETELIDGNLDKSLEYAKVLQKKQPNHYAGYMQEGDVWMAKKNYSHAQSAYNIAWQHKQTAQLAKKIFSASKPGASHDKAIQPMLTWLKNNPDDYSTRFYLASIYQSAEENDMAIQEYEKILKKTPDNSTVLNNLAWLYSLNGNPKAMDMAESAYRFSPKNPGILDTYGWILLQQGQVEKGQRLIKQAMDVIPGNLDIRYHYASALLKSGNNAEGKQLLEELLNQDKPFGGREEAKQLLKNL